MGFLDIQQVVFTYPGRTPVVDGVDWRIAAVGWGLFALLWLTTRYVSLGSVSGAVSFPVTTLFFCPGNWTVFVLSLLIAALVIWAHRENISRLLHGTESRFRWHTDAP